MDPMTGLSDKLLEQIQKRITDALNPRSIYLYGSYAYGDSHPDSDIDLLVVVDSNEDTLTLAARGYIALKGLKVPVELNVVSIDDFNKHRHWQSSVERDAAERGKQLYAA